MRTTMFTGAQMRAVSYKASEHVETVHIPTLSAYAVEYAEFTPPRDVDSGYHLLHSGADFELKEQNIMFASGFSLKFGGRELSASYSLSRHPRPRIAFPTSDGAQLKVRLGAYYQEADATFEKGAWLSFALMSAAIYEGLLAWKLGRAADKFAALIETARSRGVLDTSEYKILQKARVHRNLVHASRYEEPWVERASAMDMRTTLDGLIRKLSMNT
jgi:hypothetical protein